MTGLLPHENPTFIRLPIFHTITATFTRLPLTFTRILFPGTVRKSAENAKMLWWKLLHQGIFACYRVKDDKKSFEIKAFSGIGGEKEIAW